MNSSVLVVDDHPLYRDALIPLVKEVVADAEIITATSVEEASRLVSNFSKLRLVILDLTLPGLSGIDGITTFYRSHPSAAIVVISGSDDRRDVSAAFRAGARAFISKDVSRSTVIRTMRRALAGELSKPEWVRSSQGSVFLDDHALPLSQRQLEIMDLLAKGVSNKEIAAQVGLAEITVKQHITVIFRVLGVDNRAQALLAIRRFGLDK